LRKDTTTDNPLGPEWIIIVPPGEYNEMFYFPPGPSIEGYLLDEFDSDLDEKTDPAVPGAESSSSSTSEESTEKPDKDGAAAASKTKTKIRRPVFSLSGSFRHKNSIFEITATPVSIKNLTLRGAFIGINVAHCSKDIPVVIENCIFDDCVYGIASDYSDVQVTRCDFPSCTYVSPTFRFSLFEQGDLCFKS
jgi:hypothetical protein